MTLSKFCNAHAGKKALFTVFSAFTPLLPLSACDTMKAVPQNVSTWAGKVARPESQLPKECAGWQKIELKNHSRYALMQKDQKLLLNIDAHNLRGRNLGCWK